ncbi:MAG TPA: HesA/MoeB/ThiF family protein [Dongiaceae bacterium]|jgi:adenylyltransferase/sulfurtransferase|nr:HesA/MoeB/ThiF family protein [Dongiaceae bacterium]
MTGLTDPQLERYARQAILEEVGEEGQARLLGARVLIVGLGGLGAPLALYLAGAGIGHLGLLDDGTVELSNLHRQPLYDAGAVGARKVDATMARLRALDADLSLTAHAERLTDANARDLIARYDIVAEASDTMATRYAVNKACLELGKSWVSAGVVRFEGQITTFRPDGPCYACLFPHATAERAMPRCEQAGILGPTAGLIGTWQGAEILKELLGIGETLAGRLMLWDGLAGTLTAIRYEKRSDCRACSGKAAISPIP